MPLIFFWPIILLTVLVSLGTLRAIVSYYRDEVSD